MKTVHNKIHKVATFPAGLSAHHNCLQANINPQLFRVMMQAT
ncbi:hypothetical protein [Candidatus Lariskella endosymbiont of Epinotia ramella]